MFSITNVVMVAYFDQNIDLNKLYHAIPIEDFSKYKMKSKIPFINIEGIIVNKSYDRNSMGIRKDSNTMKQIITLDLQYRGKNNHIKVSNGKFHVTGLKNVEDSKETIDYVKKFINCIHQHIININRGSKDPIYDSYSELTSYEKPEDIKFFMKPEEEISIAFYKIENIMYHKPPKNKLNLGVLTDKLVENRKDIIVNYINFISPQVMKISKIEETPMKAKIYAKGGFMFTSKGKPQAINDFYDSLNEYVEDSYIK